LPRRAQPSAPLPASARKPNVLVILADDLGYGDVDVHVCKDIPTPHIDAIARRGILGNPERRTCAAVTWKMDKAIGNVMLAMRDLNLADQTLVFSSVTAELRFSVSSLWGLSQARPHLIESSQTQTNIYGSTTPKPKKTHENEARIPHLAPRVVRSRRPSGPGEPEHHHSRNRNRRAGRERRV
jgi:hypothetical protein